MTTVENAGAAGISPFGGLLPMDIEQELLGLRTLVRGFNPPCEERFRNDYVRSSVRQVRIGLSLALLLIAVYGYLDAILLPGYAKALWSVRFGFCCPVVLSGLLLTYTRWIERAMQPIVALTAALAGIGFVLMSMIAPPAQNFQHFSGVFLIMAATYTFIRLRFVWATLAAWAITAAYAVAHWMWSDSLNAPLFSPLSVLINTNIIGMTTVYLLEYYQRRNFLQQHLLEQKSEEIREQQRLAEKLLLDILPAEVAEELKAKGAVSPRYFADVTILFTDFQGFTRMTEELPAEDLVNILHAYFSAFDEIAQKYSMEKLKTIGDSYMCVGGLPSVSQSHAVDAVLAAFEIIEKVDRLNRQFKLDCRIRVGLHTGPVVSGVVGVRKIAYDIWGATVNFASRMESSGSPGRVNVSIGTAARVRDFFVCMSRGMVGTKDRRDFEMYFVEGCLPNLLKSATNGIPCPFAERYLRMFGKPLQAFPASLLPLEDHSTETEPAIL